jgi:TonB family protein
MTSEFAPNGLSNQVNTRATHGEMVGDVGALRRSEPIPLNQANANGQADTVCSPVPSKASTFDQVMINYYCECKYRIKKCWKPSPRVGTLRVGAHFRIHRNGYVSDIVVTQTSGSAADDSSAINAIKRANPLAPLPLGCPGYLEVDFIFEINFGSNSEALQEIQSSFCPPRRKSSPPSNFQNGAMNRAE